MRTSRAAFRRARCWPRSPSSCSPALIVAATFFWLGRRDTAVERPARADPGAARPVQDQAAQPGGLDIGRRERDRVRNQRRRGQGLAARPQQGARNTGREAGQGSRPKRLPADDEGAREAGSRRLSAKPAGAPGSVVQLGAFANQAQAERAWTALSARFPPIAAMNKLIVPFSGGIRLRAGAASPADAKQACQTLKAAGENCFVAR